jgi:hypothetical protein
MGGPLPAMWQTVDVPSFRARGNQILQLRCRLAHLIPACAGMSGGPGGLVSLAVGRTRRTRRKPDPSGRWVSRRFRLSPE